MLLVILKILFILENFHLIVTRELEESFLRIAMSYHLLDTKFQCPHFCSLVRSSWLTDIYLIFILIYALTKFSEINFSFNVFSNYCHAE